VEDPVEIRRRIQRLVQRVSRRDDYGKLLTAGQAVVRASSIEDSQAWRAEIKRRARADKIKVRTGTGTGTAWAVLQDGYTPAREAETDRYFDLLAQAVPRALTRRHEPILVVRDGDETLFRCQRCPALGYTDTGEGAVIGGPLFEDECPHDSPPEPTSLSFWVG
jgi:hypothetical protein